MGEDHAGRLERAMSRCCDAPIYTDREDGGRYCSVCDWERDERGMPLGYYVTVRENQIRLAIALAA